MNKYFEIKDNHMARETIQLRWFVTERCNYNCGYCGQDHSGKSNIIQMHSVLKHPYKIIDYKNHIGRNKRHMFDNFSWETWINALKIFKNQDITITFTGGEAFLDHKNFAPFLKTLSHQDNIRVIRIDTNGTWNPKTYAGVNWDKIFLNHSFHPSQITFKDFKKALNKKIDMGINIGMVNYVMAPEQLDNYLQIKNDLKEMGIFTNCGIYFGPGEAKPENKEIYKSFLSEFDIDIKMNLRKVKDSPCYYPALGYLISPSGFIEVGCHPHLKGDFIGGKLPKLFSNHTPCPADRCFCLDMYCFLKDSKRGKSINLLHEYIENCKEVENTKL